MKKASYFSLAKIPPSLSLFPHKKAKSKAPVLYLSILALTIPQIVFVLSRIQPFSCTVRLSSLCFALLLLPLLYHSLALSLSPALLSCKLLQTIILLLGGLQQQHCGWIAEVVLTGSRFEFGEIWSNGLLWQELVEYIVCGDGDIGSEIGEASARHRNSCYGSGMLVLEFRWRWLWSLYYRIRDVFDWLTTVFIMGLVWEFLDFFFNRIANGQFSESLVGREGFALNKALHERMNKRYGLSSCRSFR